ncbi:MAG: CRISPR-associated endonuclease Cas3'', partial [Propionibacteriaceae bacterium]|nr:CRISPR-associated endonuclease Cas3'' [Propionibacteriaceae bacterium]
MLVRAVTGAGDSLVAHTPSQVAPTQWHSLRDHLLVTSWLAEQFAQPFGGGSVARFAGLVHDAGKAVDDVQRALRRAAKDHRRRLGVPHKEEGAELAYLVYERDQRAGLAISFVTYGHHGGLPDHSQPHEQLWEMKDDPSRLDLLIDSLDRTMGISLRQEAAAVTLPPGIVDGSVFGFEMFTRMCHSALVDADSLDTSCHFERLSEPRLAPVRGMVTLADTFWSAYERKYEQAEPTSLNQLRSELYARALDQARCSQSTTGIFRLPAQTGMGKTMAAAACALEHARTHGQRRVIVAVPYTSITTQNAAQYRTMYAELGDDVVLEHHSAIYEDNIADDRWRRLSASNWDAEFIVTTTVQLFDSLLSNRPSKTRKLHRIASSVIVIDEVQALPREALPAILRVLRELTEHFGVTVVLASATQPSFWKYPEWEGVEFTDISPIDYVPQQSVRVKYEMRNYTQTWGEIADELVDLPQVLSI